MAAVRVCKYKSMCGHVHCAWACGTSSPDPLVSRFQLHFHYCPFSQKLMAKLSSCKESLGGLVYKRAAQQEEKGRKFGWKALETFSGLRVGQSLHPGVSLEVGSQGCS